MAIKTAIRYRITVNGESRVVDSKPTDDHLRRIECFVLSRGGHARVDELRTTIDTDAIGTGRGVEIRDRCLLEIEG